MSEAKSKSEMMTELKVSAHLMQLDPGVYCVSHTPGSPPPDPATGLPGARLSLPPGPGGQGVTISGFRDDGWLGGLDSAALIRVTRGPGQVLMTVYQHPNTDHPAPRLQVTRLMEGDRGAPGQAAGAMPVMQAEGGLAASEAEIAAHVQRRGDVLARFGDWVGDKGSQRWIEGFALSPHQPGISSQEIEYQAVLGRGWLSPWSEGGQYCGSRGMALPILGLRVRLRGDAAQTHSITVSATFTDGESVGPVGPGEACETESLAPLEAFRIDVTSHDAGAANRVATGVAARTRTETAKPAGKRAAPRKPAAPEPVAAPKGKPASKGRGR